MCGRFAVTTDPALLAEKIKALDETREALADAARAAGPNYNVAPTTTVSAVVRRHTRPDGSAPPPRSSLAEHRRPNEPDDEPTRRVRSMRWGLVPPWVKANADGSPETKGPLLINARAEKITSSPAFRASAKHKRCLVPMDGWYEWLKQGAQKGSKTPFYMCADDGEPLFMAGLWSTWRPAGADKAEPPLLSCTIITTDAAGPLAAIHDRMPLSISAADWDRWLDPDAPVDEGLLRGHGDLDRIVIREVAPLVNSIRNNGPELIAPVDPKAHQAELF